MKKANDYKTMDKGEINVKVEALREKLRVFRYDTVGARTKNVRESRVTRREIARALTAMGTKK
jgi:ribosomal protein L29